MRILPNQIVISLFVLLSTVAFSSCSDDFLYLQYALKAAGDNRSELIEVLNHYKRIDRDHEKLAAAKFLISNMPAHYSYNDTSAINRYYSKALEILGTGPSPDWQMDTLREISDREYFAEAEKVISDVEVITSDYLINSIDKAFTAWRTHPWASHLTFNEFKEWILPYKVTELQSFDAWRDSLSNHYSDSLSVIPESDFERNSTYGAIEIVRNEIHTKQSAIGLRVIWQEREGIPLRSAATWLRMTYGSCLDYVTMGTAVFRSLGFPVVIDQVPSWGRNSEGHSWYVFLDDHGQEQATVNSLILPAGFQFYPYERIPKVWRKTYSINRDVVNYRNRAEYVYPFEICRQDVTDRYNLTSDLEIDIDEEKRQLLKDNKYVYIAMAVKAGDPQWKVLDFGLLKRNKACFRNMGRNMLYIALGFDGKKLIPISRPFILYKNGRVDYLDVGDDVRRTAMDIRRKYYQSYNVVDMRRRLLGGKFQCSDNPEFNNPIDLYTIGSTEIPHLIELNAPGYYQYWRFMCADNSWGSLSELSFHDEYGLKMEGRGVANKEAGQDAIDRAFDGNLLSNFEINQPDGNWVGLDLGREMNVHYGSVSPRSDDNDVCPGNEYELFFFDGSGWHSLGYRVADDNSLHYDNIPLNTLMWLRNYTRGKDERPFIVRENGDIEWW